MERKIKKQITGFRTKDGAGVHLVRDLGHETVEDYDPILMLDSFDSIDPDEYTAGFPMHPHRGIETISYVYRGQMTHKDSLGNEDTIGDGEVQWMTAGSGILHEEKLPASQRLLGVQLWLNLPAKDKMVQPAYHYDIHLNPNASILIDIEEDRSVMVFTLLGDSYIGGELVKEKTAVKLTEGKHVEIRATGKNSQVLFISTKFLGESISWGGPIVMNTKEELNKAFDDLKKGTFVQDGISY